MLITIIILVYMMIAMILLTKFIDNHIYFVYNQNMIKHIESGISGKGLGFHYLQWIKNLAINFQIKGIVFTKPDGSIKVVAEGEERDLMKFANKLERESNSREIENFYTKWAEPNKDLES